MKPAIVAALNGSAVAPAVLRSAFQSMFSGEATPAQMAALLVALHIRGESAEQLAIAAKVMREHCVPVKLAPKPVLLDTCGTGGDSHNTFNISTAAAIVLAACGVPIAKHGNRAASSRTGSADVLEALGVRIDLTPDQVAGCIDEVGIGFMYARAHHPAMRHVASVRSELGVRTIFNCLGPLCNPAGATHQVIGVASPQLLVPFAEALVLLGVERAWVVCGQGQDSQGSLDEMSLFGITQGIEVNAGEMRSLRVHPEDAGLPCAATLGARVRSAEESAAIIRAVLRGDRGAARDVVVLNVAAGLMVAQRARSLIHAAQTADAAISSGAALETLTTWSALTQSFGSAGRRTSHPDA